MADLTFKANLLPNTDLGKALGSSMTEEEEMRYPSRIIGTISEIPDYEIWEAGDDGRLKIKVNGRIWIRIR